MALVNHWIAIDETGRGAIGLNRETVTDALPGARIIAVSTYPVWDLSMAMIRGGHLTIQFSLEHHGARSNALRERRGW